MYAACHVMGISVDMPAVIGAPSSTLIFVRSPMSADDSPAALGLGQRNVGSQPAGAVARAARTAPMGRLMCTECWTITGRVSSSTGESTGAEGHLFAVPVGKGPIAQTTMNSG